MVTKRSPNFDFRLCLALELLSSRIREQATISQRAFKLSIPAIVPSGRFPREATQVVIRLSSMLDTSPDIAKVDSVFRPARTLAAIRDFALTRRVKTNAATVPGLLRCPCFS
jgi:hypothetical protein